MRTVATILAYNDAGQLLMGRRRDNGKWTNIGGHVEDGEHPHDAALRELLEEANLRPAGGEMSYVGEDYIPENDILVLVFSCPVAGRPTPKNDPDQEIGEYNWFSPENIPSDDQLHVPFERNVLLQYFLPDGRLNKAGEKGKTVKYWKSKDGIKIPVSGTPERMQYNKAFHESLVTHFARGEKSRLKRIKVLTELPQGSNMPVNKDRLTLYTKMARAGERLPPVVVRRNGMEYSLIDGNHRQAAAKAAGHTHMDAFEIIEPKKK